MQRNEFLRTSGLVTAATFLTPAQASTRGELPAQIDVLAGADGKFIQAPLPYTEVHLEPYMDAETLHLHYTFHHGGAVKKANDALERIQNAVTDQQFALSDHWTKKLSLQLSSHILHSIFWTNLTPKASEPSGELLKSIDRDFGGIDRLKGLLAHISKNVDGNGWGILGYQPFTGRLAVMGCENHEKLTQWGVIPLLVIDVWEHAYYLKYRNERDRFVDTLFSIIDWDNVAFRYDQAWRAFHG